MGANKYRQRTLVERCFELVVSADGAPVDRSARQPRRERQQVFVVLERLAARDEQLEQRARSLAH